MLVYNKEMEEIVWDGPEFHFQEKDLDWYLLIGVTGVVLLSFALWQHNLLFAFFVLISLALVVALAHHEAPMHRHRVDQHGIHISHMKTYHFRDLEGFAVEHTGELASGWGTIRLLSRHSFMPYVHIFIPVDQLHHVRTFLAAHIEEFQYEHTLTDALLHWFRI